MLSFAPTTIFAGPWDHRPSVSSPLSSSPIRASSPLSPVDRNALSQRQIQSSPIQQPKFKFASRPVRQNPLLRKREDLQDARRKNFLQNVRQKADEKAWQRRDVEGQLLKNSLLADIGRLSHDAPFLSETDLEDAMAFHQERPPTEDDEMPDEHPLDDDLEDMVASFEEQQSQSQNQGQNQSQGQGQGQNQSQGQGQGQTHGDQRPPSPTLSDEDYDDIFAELIAQEQEQSSIQSFAEHMDMS